MLYIVESLVERIKTKAKLTQFSLAVWFIENVSCVRRDRSKLGENGENVTEKVTERDFVDDAGTQKYFFVFSFVSACNFLVSDSSMYVNFQHL